MSKKKTRWIRVALLDEEERAELFDQVCEFSRDVLVERYLETMSLTDVEVLRKLADPNSSCLESEGCGDERCPICGVG
jgi:hypothetical protein